MTRITKSEKETEALGEELGRRVRPGDTLAFFGGLGMGKTAFIRGLARGMGITARVSSPTFTIVNEYPGPVPLFHFDMYRIGGEDELFGIGWEDYLSRGGVIALEWSENVEPFLEPGYKRITIERTGDGERKITIDDTEMSA